MRISYLLFLGLLFSTKVLFAQHSEESEHSHHKNEIGIANSPVFLLKEKEFAYGLHLHYIRNIHHSKFGIGLGYERIFDDHKHNTIGIVGSYNPVDRVFVNISPGISFEDNAHSGVNFAFHLETTYDFEFKNFHLGPALEFAYGKEDYHISIGLHVGFGF